MHKIKDLFQHHKQSENRQSIVETSINDASNASATLELTEENLYRYRKQRGVNLGSWFVLERWIAESPFRCAQSPAQSDLDVARGSQAKTILERHWDEWITEIDWQWIAQRGINTVRIPIGFYHICGIDPSVLQGTDFSQFQDVFGGAWNRITNAIATAHRHGLGVLLDLHAAPGKQNADAHAGASSPPSFFSSKFYMTHTIHILRVLLTQLLCLPHPNIVGIELLNEPAPPNDPALQKWYTAAIRELRNIDPEHRFPLYLGECWRTQAYTEYVKSIKSPEVGLGIIALDHHLYRCFTGQDISTPAAQHTHALQDQNLFSDVTRALEGAECGSGLIIGEWSGALNPGSLASSQDQNEDRRAYIAAQLDLFERRCAGNFFWTYKKEQRGDKGWSLKDAVEGGVYPNWVGLKLKEGVSLPGSVGDSDEQGRRDKAKDRLFGDHTNYWSQYPGTYEHWRFAEGFTQGWDDAYKFFGSSSGSLHELGFKGAWVKRRIVEHVKLRGGGKCLWEFEHGFMQGVDTARLDFEAVYC